MKTQRAKACDISQKVKRAVLERDKYCILCGNPNAAPNAHFISRAQGGLGIEENIVTLCFRCHERYDHTTNRPVVKEMIRNYLKSKYPNWDEKNLIYRRENYDSIIQK